MLSPKRKNLRYMALLNAAAMIQDHSSGGMCPDDIGLDEEDWDGLAMYTQECESVSKRINTLAEAFKRNWVLEVKS